jgi:hypothetical protein
MPQLPENNELRSDEVQEIITKVPHFLLRYGSFCFLLVIILVLSLSYLIKYPDIIVAQAIVTTRNTPQKEIAQLNTRVDTLLIKESGAIKTGALVMVLESTASYKDILALEKVMNTVNIEEDFFKFPIYDLPILFLGDLESDFAAFENAYLNYDLNRKLRPLDNTINSQQFNRKELQLQLENLLSRKRNNLKELELKKAELQRIRVLYEKGVIAKQELELKELDIIQYERNYKSFTSQISQLRNQIYNSTGTIKGINIENETANFTLRRQVNQAFVNLRRAIKSYKNTYLLYSQKDGELNFSQNYNKGNFVQSGEVLFTIFPSESNGYLALCKTPALNTGKIREGQHVRLDLVNYPDAEYGSLMGQVKSMSAITDKDGNYTVMVELPSQLKTTYNKKIKLSQESLAIANVITEDLRLLDRFIYKFRDLFSRN